MRTLQGRHEAFAICARKISFRTKGIEGCVERGVYIFWATELASKNSGEVLTRIECDHLSGH